MNPKGFAIGLKENLQQFILLIIINLFIGSMVGLERTILPLLGEQQFGLASASAALSFIISFGFSKALMNLFSGRLADQIGRKRVLWFGWIFAIPVPLFVIFANAWWIIVLANIFLGINQGMTWSMTVNMKMDLVKGNQRGLALGFNEFSGYMGMAIAAFASGYLATTYSLRPEPFYLGIGIVIVGLILTTFIKETGSHIRLQAQLHSEDENNHKKISSIALFKKITWQNRSLSSTNFAGLSTNLKDGMAWGLFPIYFITAGLSIKEVGLLVAIYPATWGIFQLFTGYLSDRVGRKWMITFGMWTQAAAIWWILIFDNYGMWIFGSIFLGLGTAMVYPTLLASISDVARPEWRASALGIYRFWRDSGYAFGALIAGLLMDALNITWAIGLVALLPWSAGFVIAFRMKETLKMMKKR